MPDGILTRIHYTSKYRCHSTPKRWKATTIAQRMAALCLVALRRQTTVNLHNQTTISVNANNNWLLLCVGLCFVLYFLEWLFLNHKHGSLPHDNGGGNTIKYLKGEKLWTI